MSVQSSVNQNKNSAYFFIFVCRFRHRLLYFLFLFLKIFPYNFPNCTFVWIFRALHVNGQEAIYVLLQRFVLFIQHHTQETWALKGRHSTHFAPNAIPKCDIFPSYLMDCFGISFFQLLLEQFNIIAAFYNIY